MFFFFGTCSCCRPEHEYIDTIIVSHRYIPVSQRFQYTIHLKLHKGEDFKFSVQLKFTTDRIIRMPETCGECKFEALRDGKTNIVSVRPSLA